MVCSTIKQPKAEVTLLHWYSHAANFAPSLKAVENSATGPGFFGVTEILNFYQNFIALDTTKCHQDLLPCEYGKYLQE